MPLPKLRCKKDYIPKPIAQILFNSKCEGGGDGKKQRGTGRVTRLRERDLCLPQWNFCLDAFPRMCYPDFARLRASPILCLPSGQNPSVILTVFESIVISKSLVGGKMIFWVLGFFKSIFKSFLKCMV